MNCIPFIQFKALLTATDVEYNFHISWQIHLYWNYEYYEWEVLIHLSAQSFNQNLPLSGIFLYLFKNKFKNAELNVNVFIFLQVILSHLVFLALNPVSSFCQGLELMAHSFHLSR